MRVFSSLAVLLLVVTAFGCGTSDKTSNSIEDPVGGSGTAGSGGSNADSSTDADSVSDGAAEDSKLDSKVDSSAEDFDSSLADSFQDTAVGKDVVLEYNIQPCPVASQAIGTRAFKATSPSPSAFVAAYNAELSSMSYPGPMLMVFNGLDSLDSSKWKLQVGPLAGADGSSKVCFASSPAEVSFGFGEGFAINFPNTPAKFALRFATATTVVDLPIVGISLSGVFDKACSGLKVEVVGMYVPSTAAALSFHGSTVGALMGTPDQDIDGGTANAWLLVLSGAAQPVELQ